MPSVGQAWVEIGARTEQFEQNIRRSVGLLDQFGRPIQKVEAGTRQLTSTTQKASTAVAGLNRSAGGASTTLIAMSGGIQDIPYGLRGVINNVQFTGQSFTQLIATTGSLRAAMTALGATLTGPAGIFLAFSAATVAMQLWSESAGSAKKEAQELKEALDELLTVDTGLPTFETSGAGLIEAVGVSRDEITRLEEQLSSLRRQEAAFAGTLNAERQLELELIRAKITSTKTQLDEERGILSVFETQLSKVETQTRAATRLSQITGIRAKQEDEVVDKLREQTSELEKQARFRSVGIPTRPGPSVSFPEGFDSFGGFEDLSARAAREFAALPVEERIRATTAAGVGPAAPGPVIDLSAFEDLGETTGRLTSDMETLRIDGAIPVNNAFQDLATGALRDFAFELGDAIVDVALFGQSLKDTIENIGQRAAGSLVGAAINLGIGALVTAATGGNIAAGAAAAGGASALTGAANRPDTSGLSNLSARISMGDIVIEQQRTATRNNLNLVGLS